MGGLESIPIVNNEFPVMCIYFVNNDTLTLLHGSQELIDLVHALIQRYYKKGVQRQTMNSYGAIEYKLNGYPFSNLQGEFFNSDTRQDMIDAQIMCGYMLKKLLEHGWILMASSDLSRTDSLERSAWFFRRSTPIVVGPLSNVPNFTISKDDRLIFLGINSQMRDELVNLIAQEYHKGVQEVNHLDDNGIRIKLHGYPWDKTWGLENDARPLLLSIIQYFEKHGFYFYGTASLKGQTDTVYFMPAILTWPLKINPPLEPAYGNHYFAIGLDNRDRLRLFNCSDVRVQQIIETTINSFWRRGIQGKKVFGQCVEWKLAGNPWWSDGKDTVDSRMLITQIFQKLHQFGWAIMAALDTSVSLSDTSFLIFRSTPSRPMNYICISLNEINKIRLINASDDIVKAVHTTINTSYTYGIDKFVVYEGVPEFKLKGAPWGGQKNYSIHGRQLLAFIVDGLTKLGYVFAISADVSEKCNTSYKGDNCKYDIHSWWLARPIS